MRSEDLDQHDLKSNSDSMNLFSKCLEKAFKKDMAPATGSVRTGTYSSCLCFPCSLWLPWVKPVTFSGVDLPSCFLRYLPKASTETTGNSYSEQLDIRD